MTAQAIQVIDDADRAGRLFHPLRRRILSRLAQSPDSASGLARTLDLPRQRVNYHLRELEEDGLVELEQERRRGNCVERVVRARGGAYLIDPGALGELAPDPSSWKDRFSWSYLIACAARMIRELSIIRRAADSESKQIPTFTLETEIRFRTPEALHAFSEALSNEVARLVAEHHAADADAGRLFRFLIGAHPAVTKPELVSEEPSHE